MPAKRFNMAEKMTAWRKNDMKTGVDEDDYYGARRDQYGWVVLHAWLVGCCSHLRHAHVTWCRQEIHWEDYGNRNHEHGWEVDHQHARKYGGDHEHNNLRAMQWLNNVKKSSKNVRDIPFTEGGKHLRHDDD